MTWQQGPDAPRPADARRMRAARGKARRAIIEAEARYVMSSTEAFRYEIGATVQSASPFLIVLLASDGMLLDDVVEMFEPGCGWPRRPRLSLRGNAWLAGKHALRHVAAGLGHYVWPDTLLMHGCSVDLSGYTSANVRIISHSVEVRVRLRTVTFDTCFGLLRIELGRRLPETLAIACVGRLVEEIVDHSSLRGSGWKVAAVEPSINGSVLVVDTGSVDYKLPWARS